MLGLHFEGASLFWIQNCIFPKKCETKQKVNSSPELHKLHCSYVSQRLVSNSTNSIQFSTSGSAIPSAINRKPDCRCVDRACLAGSWAVMCPGVLNFDCLGFCFYYWCNKSELCQSGMMLATWFCTPGSTGLFAVSTWHCTPNK